MKENHLLERKKNPDLRKENNGNGRKGDFRPRMARKSLLISNEQGHEGENRKGQKKKIYMNIAYKYILILKYGF